MTAIPIDPSAVTVGDFVHYGTASCPGDQFLEVLVAPAGKNYVGVKQLGVTKWILRTDIRSAMRPIAQDPVQPPSAIIDTRQGGGLTGTTK